MFYMLTFMRNVEFYSDQFLFDPKRKKVDHFLLLLLNFPFPILILTAWDKLYFKNL